MTTPQPPGIVFTHNAPSPPPARRGDDVVFAAGLLGTGATAGPGDTVTITSVADLAALGSDGPLRLCLGDLLDQQLVTVVVQAVTATTAGKPSGAEVSAALEVARAMSSPPTVMMAPALTAGSDADASLANSSAASAVAAKLKSLAAEFDDTIAILDPPGSAGHSAANAAAAVALANTWAGNNRGQRAMCVFNGPRMSSGWRPACGAWLGAALARSTRQGRAWGLADTPVNAGQLQYDLTSSRSPTATTQISSLVGNYISVLHQAPGGAVIVGETMGGYTDVRRLWSVQRVVDHADLIMRGAVREHMGGATTVPTLREVAGIMQRAGRQLVQQTPKELNDVTVTVDEALNDPAARLAQTAYFDVTYQTIIPLSQVRVNVTLTT